MTDIDRDELLALLLDDEAPAAPTGPGRRTENGPAPLSFAQRRLWFLQQYEVDSPAYNSARALRIHGQPDVSALQAALRRLIERHASLRTRFVLVDDLPMQVIEPRVDFQLECVNLPANANLEAELRQRVAMPFDLGQAPLLRGSLLCGEEGAVLLLCLHHIVADAWSNPLLIADLGRAYATALGGNDRALPSLPLDYADYATWQRQRFAGQGAAEGQAYWREYLGRDVPVLELPSDRPPSAAPRREAARRDVRVPAATARAVREFCRQQHCSPFVLLLGAWQVLLARYSGQRDFAVGVPNAARSHAQVQDIVGFFVNTQVYRARLEPHLTTRNLCGRLRDESRIALEQADFPFECVLDGLNLTRDLHHTALFQVLFNFRHSRDAQALQLPGLHVQVLDIELESARFDLSLDVIASPDGIDCRLEYATARYDATTIDRLAQNLCQLLQGMVAAPDRSVFSLPLLGVAELEQLGAWNATDVRYPQHPNLPALLAEQVRATPDALALVYADARLSYAELDARANQLAHWLQGQGVGPDVPVAVCAERSVELVVALLGVIKAGGAYLPLDPDHPRERLQGMLADSGSPLLLTQAHLLGKWAGDAGVPVHALERLPLGIQPLTAPSVDIGPENLVYCLYTSGSTGKPKAVGNRHAGLLNRLQWMQAEYGLSASDRVLQKTPYSFDVSVWEFFWPLLSGAALVMAPPGAHRDPQALRELIVEHGITTLHFVPSMLQAFVSAGELPVCTSLKRILCSGEALPGELQRQVLSQTASELHNLYGPTEAAIDVTSWACREDGKSVPIGRPIANTQIHILDADLNPVPVGVAGELYIAGVNLARGYQGRPSLTAERFVANPYGALGERMYRSGDLARWRADGAIEYLGRLDHQVKLRGQRIELGEIEAVLLAHANVRESVVIARDDKLIGYWVGDATEEEVLKAHLAQHVPEYMVPWRLVQLDAMPLSANGKLDRKQLPQPEGQAAAEDYIAPRSEAEQALAAIWAEVLGLEQVGIADNFFELGGDSILSLQVISRARRAGWQLNPRDLFEHQHIAALARVAVPLDQARVDSAAGQGEAPITPIQAHFFAQAVPVPGHWNQALLLRPLQNLAPPALGEALLALFAHHDALRLQFQRVGGRWCASHGNGTASLLDCQTLSGPEPEAIRALCEEAQRGFDLGQGPLFKALLMQLGDGEQRLLLVAHHLVVDGVSWRILLEDLAQLYTQALAGSPLGLAPRTSSFKAWGEYLRHWAHQGLDNTEQAYWQAYAETPATALSVQRPQGSRALGATAHVRMQLDPVRTRALLGAAHGAYRTRIDELLLAGLAQTLCQWSGQPAVDILLEGHGRTPGADAPADLDLSRSVGWFTALYPLQLAPGSESPAQIIKAIKEQLRQVPGQGLGYGMLRYLGEDALAGQLAAREAPQVTFNYLGQFDPGRSAGGLFAWAEESLGASLDPSADADSEWVITGQVRDGCLQLSWRYGTERFDSEVVQALAERYLATLGELIDHCLSPDAAGVTPSDFPLASVSQSQLDALPVAAADLEDLYPLSPLQQGMLFHSLQGGASSAYVNQVCVPLSDVDGPRFAAAWERVTEEHAILRAGFAWEGDLPQPLQWIHRQLPSPVRHLDWRTRSAAQARLDLAELADAQRDQGFDLRQPPLQRVLLVRLGESDYQLIWTRHHILLDGWATAQLIEEVLLHYRGESPTASASRYRDYLAWLARQDATASHGFWSEQLRQLDEPTRLADALPAVPAQAGHGDLRLQLDASVTSALAAFARRERVTLNTLMQGAWSLLLQRYTGQRSVAFGATVAGRPAALADAERVLGLFINTLPIIQAPGPGRLLGDWLRELQSLNLAVREHEHTPLFDIQRWAGQGGQALFDSVLVFENYPVDSALRSGSGVRFGQVISRETTHYPLTVVIHAGDTLNVQLSYLLGAFDAASVVRLGEHFKNLLLAMASQVQGASTLRLGELRMLDTAELRQLSELNATSVRYPQYRNLPALIAEQVRATPDALALVYADARLSYAELDARANQLAHWLQSQGVGPDVPVAVCAERSVELVVALLGVIKAGGAYLPLDPDHPRERLQGMLADSGSPLLLTQAHLLGKWAGDAGVPVHALERLPLGIQPLTAPSVDIGPENLVYCLYTSGSTGKPKAVGNRHAGLLNRLQWMQAEYGLSASDRVLQKTPYSFDVSVWEFFWPLLSGAALVMAPPGAHRDPQALRELIVEHGITTLHFVPSMLQAFVSAGELPVCTSLKRILCSGEALPGELQRQVLSQTASELHNLYGPTEAAIDVTSWACREDGKSVPIGRPIANTQIHILDADLNPVPVGVAGELYIAGVNLARGYQGRPSLTAERFVANPYGEFGERMYRSGDLARWRADGAIEYLGRLDHQVKLRGQRIELGEIEAVLLAHDAVRECVVVARNNQLLGYWVGTDADEAALKFHLAQHVPEYMVPWRLMQLPAMPLSANGKLDRKQLPQVEAQAAAIGYVEPRNDAERDLARIWSEVLGVERVGVTDDFFELGGHSLLATRLASQIRHRLGVQIRLGAVFDTPTVEALARHLEHIPAHAAEDEVDAMTQLLNELERIE
ncbi:non-ribosomal peptide synthetase [Pseudomonas typographi]|uniref:Amino acid adenylation domain-containing protein n=2 Tax=Pseudomonas typographi TaxID=2715964 RepID=A0ABR7Z6G1_9PSED|nr:non-ribosomal peptide synthetase [Pseudomonas typographi]MBD1601106.1 amino acid adenylation domain-containing protein [Pseudomonas typographi]